MTQVGRSSQQDNLPHFAALFLEQAIGFGFYNPFPPWKEGATGRDIGEEQRDTLLFGV